MRACEAAAARAWSSAIPAAFAGDDGRARLAAMLAVAITEPGDGDTAGGPGEARRLAARCRRVGFRVRVRVRVKVSVSVRVRVRVNVSVRVRVVCFSGQQSQRAGLLLIATLPTDWRHCEDLHGNPMYAFAYG